VDVDVDGENVTRGTIAAGRVTLLPWSADKVKRIRRHLSGGEELCEEGLLAEHVPHLAPLVTAQEW